MNAARKLREVNEGMSYHRQIGNEDDSEQTQRQEMAAAAQEAEFRK